MRTTLPKWQVVTGWVLAGLIGGLLLFSASGKFTQSDDMAEGVSHLGWRMDQMRGLGVLEAAIVVIFLIPRTTVLGAVLITGYMGGAMATHVRIDEPWIIQFFVGVVAWLSVFLRDPRLRELLPIRRSQRII
ncbi:MAG: DoxX family protein [Phycisphaerae bacterium]|jgi:hypothetical protein